ncbi:MAG: hypothetical protein ACI87W_002634 [Halieaceae bacterium]|jgi:hypothetical protein
MHAREFNNGAGAFHPRDFARESAHSEDCLQRIVNHALRPARDPVYTPSR